jgi:Uma2 family endonuclease
MGKEKPPMTAPVGYRKPKERIPAHLARLLVALGGIPVERVVQNPPIGQATEEHLLRPPNGSDSLYELIDGTLVKKPMGIEESKLAVRLGGKLDDFAERHGLGSVSGADGPFRATAGLVRMPDVAFFSDNRLENEIEGESISSAVPDLGVEVLSKGNTKAEMERKLNEYFAAGVRCVWMLDPKRREVKVYTSPQEFTVLTEDDELDGGDILPGFRYSIRDWLSVLDRKRRGRK